MGREEQQENSSTSIRSRAAQIVSDLTTVYFNPISDKTPTHHPTVPEEEIGKNSSPLEPVAEESSSDSTVGPDTSSFSAFLYSLLARSESKTTSNLVKKNEIQKEMDESVVDPILKGSTGMMNLFSRGKQTFGNAFYQAAILGGYRNQASDGNGGNDFRIHDDDGVALQTFNETFPLKNLPEISEPSLLLSEKVRRSLNVTLPVLVQGRNWVMLYSTWKHGISLATLYRRSLLCPGLALLVVGDRKGAIFGGLVESPLRPTNNRKYQGTNNSFVFTNTSGHPVIFRPTGVNRYFTLCSTDFLALGGGRHFALYLDGDLLNGSSSASETYGNPCLACTEDFDVKEIELWGFVYPSKYEETVSLLKTEAPGICRW